MNIDEVVKFLTENDQGSKWLQSYTDTKVTKGIETWKENNLSNLIDEKVKELNPSADPKDVEIEKLKAELEQVKLETEKKQLTQEVLESCKDKKLPTGIVELLITSDRDRTFENVKALEEAWTQALSANIQSNLGSTAPKFGAGTENNKLDDFKKMSYAEKRELKESNPELYESLTQ